MITVLTDRENTLKGIKAGANDILKKPPDKEELCFRIRNALYTKKLFDIIESRFQTIKETKSPGESLIEKSLPDLKDCLANVNGNMQFLYRQLEAHLNSEHKDLFNDSLSSLQETVLSLDGILPSGLSENPNQLEKQRE
jgi:DNA-binding response OmpR family regulator